MTAASEKPPFPPAYLPPTEPVTRPDGSRHHAGITYAAIGGYRPLQLDLWIPAPDPTGRKPGLVLWIHGGGWMVGDRRHFPPTLRPNQLFDELLAAGLAVATIDYRHASEAQFPAQLTDAKAALRWLRHFGADLGVDTGTIGVWGESAGGHLASLVALTSERAELEGRHGVTGPSIPVTAAVVWYGLADLDAMPPLAMPPEAAAFAPPELMQEPIGVLLGGVDDATRANANPLGLVHPDAPPFLLLHGTADRLVPSEQSTILDEALRKAGVPVELVLVDGADHIFLGAGNIDELVARSVAFLAERLSQE
ncbi:alpha/beta hydrolase fold domain-containing protein [Actinoplanes sp. CA-015351]|uniref:alpha/beta hydrolase fold domain-containing protein n=1 Tax=Actinoplanes sp. CA-015351 TaxID=3239897 RepID=UPI003D996085